MRFPNPNDTNQWERTESTASTFAFFDIRMARMTSPGTSTMGDGRRKPGISKGSIRFENDMIPGAGGYGGGREEGVHGAGQWLLPG